ATTRRSKAGAPTRCSSTAIRLSLFTKPAGVCTSSGSGSTRPAWHTPSRTFVMQGMTAAQPTCDLFSSALAQHAVVADDFHSARNGQHEAAFAHTDLKAPEARQAQQRLASYRGVAFDEVNEGSVVQLQRCIAQSGRPLGMQLLEDASHE